MDRAEIAKQNFLNGYNCSQSIVLAFLDKTNLDRETAFKISSSFGGGMGRLREVCGAVSGMFMVAGMVFSKGELTNNEDKIKHYKIIQDLAIKFKEKNGAIVCRELLYGTTKNLDTSPNAEKRTAEYYKKRNCAEYVYDAAKILDDYIKEYTEFKI